MLRGQPTILEQLDRLVRRFLRAPTTAAAARIVLCLPFWWSGLTKLLDFSGGTAEMAALGIEPAWLFSALTIFVQLGGSLLVNSEPMDMAWRRRSRRVHGARNRAGPSVLDAQRN